MLLFLSNSWCYSIIVFLLNKFKPPWRSYTVCISFPFFCLPLSPNSMNKRRHIAIVLSILYVCFWASTHLFFHTHYLPDGVITHSHPYFPWDKDEPHHSHTAAQFQIIDVLGTALFVSSDPIFVFAVAICLCIILLSVTSCKSISSYYTISLLRAPPVSVSFS